MCGCFAIYLESSQLFHRNDKMQVLSQELSKTLQFFCKTCDTPFFCKTCNICHNSCDTAIPTAILATDLQRSPANHAAKPANLVPAVSSCNACAWSPLLSQNSRQNLRQSQAITVRLQLLLLRLQLLQYCYCKSCASSDRHHFFE